MSSNPINRSHHSIIEGHQVGQARSALGEATLAVSNHLKSSSYVPSIASRRIRSMIFPGTEVRESLPWRTRLIESMLIGISHRHCSSSHCLSGPPMTWHPSICVSPAVSPEEENEELTSGSKECNPPTSQRSPLSQCDISLDRSVPHSQSEKQAEPESKESLPDVQLSDSFPYTKCWPHPHALSHALAWAVGVQT